MAYGSTTQGKTHPRENPDEVKILTLDIEGFENDPDWVRKGEIVRQDLDIPAEYKVTEYRAQVYENSVTGEKVTGKFSEGVNAPFQFGKKYQATGSDPMRA
ncbi:MAG: hypothetical protein LBR53_00355 [Deltaproteobacteria bacterium]|nr:hypothetical protein [Deltaproteobacteria bacterium]